MEKQVRIAAGLYGARDAAKLMLGDKFHDRVQPMIELIRKLASDEGISEAAAAAALAKELAAKVSGASGVTMLAAYVEMIEPSKER